GRLGRIYFSHVGTLVGIVTYFVLAGVVPYPVDSFGHALRVALTIHTLYALLAWRLHELKYADVAVWVLFAVGLLGLAVGIEPLVSLYRWYSPALLFGSLALVALVPLVLGREPFTVFYGVRQTPRWQQRLPVFMQLNRVLAVYWGVVVF